MSQSEHLSLKALPGTAPVKMSLQRVLIGLCFWTSFWLGTAVTYVILAAVHLFAVLTKISPNRTIEHALFCWWPQAIWFLNQWWFGIKVEGRENLPARGEAVVMIANHESMFDIFAMYFLGAQFRWLSKKSVFKIPLLGGGMKWLGYVPIERGSPRSHVAAMAMSADWIRRGIPMFFFPEGTRSDTGELRTFKVGAFRLALECDVAILPIVIQGTRNIMPKHSGWPGPADVHVKVLPKVRAVEGETPEAFAARARDIITQQLQR